MQTWLKARELTQDGCVPIQSEHARVESIVERMKQIRLQANQAGVIVVFEAKFVASHFDAGGGQLNSLDEINDGPLMLIEVLT